MDLIYWHWLILGGVLLILEMFAPGAFMLWLGFAAGASALVALIFPGLSWEVQILLFSVFCLLSLFAWKKMGGTQEKPTDQPNLNRRGQQYVGRLFSLVDAIENGVGKVVVDDSQWKVMGDDAPVGTKVKVTGTDGTILLVEVAE